MSNEVSLFTQWLSKNWLGIVTILAAYFAFRAWIETMIEKRIDVEKSIKNYFNINLPVDLRRYYRGNKLDGYPLSVVVKDVQKIRYKIPRVFLGFPTKFVTNFELGIAKKEFKDFSEDEINKLQHIYKSLVKELNSVKGYKLDYQDIEAVDEWFIIRFQVFLTELNILEKILDSIVDYFDKNF
ncbi:hypothetical protein DRO97_05360 [Archaeoglobales archaeon]|nr:MAG: hypothetical protein DRO97_05360 [Archaeoglobales archaeon]